MNNSGSTLLDQCSNPMNLKLHRHRSHQYSWRRVGVQIIVMVALLLLRSFAVAAEAIPHSFFCFQSIIPPSDPAGAAKYVQVLKDGRMLVEADNGLFLLREI